ncbi:hypothetical protein BC629DRAFT_591497 [Irpex lacteus]|nr:hypothetical protein BC629DRAFT_591497 [Irpex lacteus]
MHMTASQLILPLIFEVTAKPKDALYPIVRTEPNHRAGGSHTTSTVIMVRQGHLLSNEIPVMNRSDNGAAIKISTLIITSEGLSVFHSSLFFSRSTTFMAIHSSSEITILLSWSLVACLCRPWQNYITHWQMPLIDCVFVRSSKAVAVPFSRHFESPPLGYS